MNNNLREAFPCAVDRTRDVTGALAPSPISKGQKFAEQLAYEDTLRPTDAARFVGRAREALAQVVVHAVVADLEVERVDDDALEERRLVRVAARDLLRVQALLRVAEVDRAEEVGVVALLRELRAARQEVRVADEVAVVPVRSVCVRQQW